MCEKWWKKSRHRRMNMKKMNFKTISECIIFYMHTYRKSITRCDRAAATAAAAAVAAPNAPPPSPTVLYTFIIIIIHIIVTSSCQSRRRQYKRAGLQLLRIGLRGEEKKRVAVTKVFRGKEKKERESEGQRGRRVKKHE